MSVGPHLGSALRCTGIQVEGREHVRVARGFTSIGGGGLELWCSVTRGGRLSIMFDVCQQVHRLKVEGRGEGAGGGGRPVASIYFLHIYRVSSLSSDLLNTCFFNPRVSSSYIFLYFPIFLATSYFLLYFREIPIFSYILEVLL